MPTGVEEAIAAQIVTKVLVPTIIRAGFGKDISGARRRAEEQVRRGQVPTVLDAAGAVRAQMARRGAIAEPRVKPERLGQPMALEQSPLPPFEPDIPTAPAPEGPAAGDADVPDRGKVGKPPKPPRGPSLPERLPGFGKVLSKVPKIGLGGLIDIISGMIWPEEIGPEVERTEAERKTEEAMRRDIWDEFRLRCQAGTIPDSACKKIMPDVGPPGREVPEQSFPKAPLKGPPFEGGRVVVKEIDPRTIPAKRSVASTRKFPLSPAVTARLLGTIGVFGSTLIVGRLTRSKTSVNLAPAPTVPITPERPPQSPPPVTPPGLRPGDISFPPFIGLEPSLAPLQLREATKSRTTDKQCQIVKRRRRRKGKCREGFFVERPGETKYTTWRVKDCATGKTITER